MSEPSKHAGKTLLAIDLSAITWWQLKSPRNNDDPKQALEGVLSKVENFAKGHSYVVICCDKGRSFRKEIYDAYKANRAEHTEIERDYADKVRAEIGKRWTVLEADGFEGDDILATIVQVVPPDVTVAIVAEDKDILPLIERPNVRLTHTQKGIAVDAAGVEKKYGIKPAQIRDMLVLGGDVSDNWKGIAGIAEGIATRLLSQFGSIDGIWKHIDEVTPDGVKQAITESPGIIELGLKVCTLRSDVPGIAEAVAAVLDSEPQKGPRKAPAPQQATGAADKAPEARGDATAVKKEATAGQAPPAPNDTPVKRVPASVPAEVPVGWSNPCNHIAAAIAKAQGVIPAPLKSKTAKIKGKTKDGTPFEYSYKYADLASIHDAIVTHLAANNIARVQSEAPDAKGGWVLRTMLVHSSGQWVVSECRIIGGDDKGDLKGAQAHGSSLTYTRRHGLCMALGLAAEDDDDGKAGSDE